MRRFKGEIYSVHKQTAQSNLALPGEGYKWVKSNVLLKTQHACRPFMEKVWWLP
jgi:hypothetical protein